MIAKDLLKEQKALPKKTEKKLRILEESVERKKFCQNFLDLWNKWRYFYFEAGPAVIKNNGQITCIENIKDLAKEHDLNLEMLIATTIRAFVGRRFMPTFQSIISDGLEYYERYYDDVLAELDEARYERDALRG